MRGRWGWKVKGTLSKIIIIMKKIIFVRHGKAEDPVAEFSDFERSLTERGKTVSRLMARNLKEKEKDLGFTLCRGFFHTPGKDNYQQ
jgi:hypothetical protein